MKIDQNCPHLERLIWVTGLPASGKTTVADILSKQLTQKKFKVLRLDGDELREALKNSENMTKYDAESRLKNALTYSALAKSLIVCGTKLATSVGFWTFSFAYLEILVGRMGLNISASAR